MAAQLDVAAVELGRLGVVRADVALEQVVVRVLLDVEALGAEGADHVVGDDVVRAGVVVVHRLVVRLRAGADVDALTVVVLGPVVVAALAVHAAVLDDRVGDSVAVGVVAQPHTLAAGAVEEHVPRW